MKKYLPKFQNPAGKLPGGTKLQSGPTQLDFANKALSSTSGIKVVNSDENLKNSWKKSTQDEIDKNGSYVGKGLSERGAGVMSAVSKGAGMATDLMTSMIDVDKNSSFETEQALGDGLLQSGNPYAMAAGAVVKFNSALNQAMDTNMNTISEKEASEVGIGMGGRLLNNVAGFMGNIGIPGIGALFGKTDSVKMSEQTKSLSNAFGGSVDDIQTAEGMSGGRYVVGKDKINALINESDRQNRLITNLSVINTQRKASDYGLDLAQQNLNRYAGNNYQNIHVGKHGMKLINIEECRRILEARKGVEMFQNGGVLSGNILPTGKLHKELHHIEDSNPELAEELTRKGIPVVAINEDGNFEEVAEIERDEWTLSKELTDKLESLWKDGSEEAMLECGKLMCEEILFNTRDDNNLLGNEDNTDKD